MKIAGVVVIYNPDDTVLENIKTYIDIVEKLYVVDNSIEKINIVNEIKKILKVEYISLNGNKGIAKALKVATEKAIGDGYDFLLSMDQDSQFPTEHGETIKNCLKSQDTARVGMLGINYKNNSSADKLDTVINVNCIITSGAFLNLHNYKQINGYNEDLFIDLVDNDICFQFILAGYDVLLMPHVHIKHKLGKTKNVNCLWYKREIITHSPIRYYYMYRNYNYLLKHRSKKYRRLLKQYKYGYGFKLFVRRVLFEKPRWKIFKMICKGIRDGKRGILGPYETGEK